MKLSLIVGCSFLVVAAVFFLFAPYITAFDNNEISTPETISSRYEDYQPNSSDEMGVEFFLSFPPRLFDEPDLHLEMRNMLAGTVLMVLGGFIVGGKSAAFARSPSFPDDIFELKTLLETRKS